MDYGLGSSKTDIFKSSIGSGKIRNSRQSYDKLKFFEKIYF
jgi:hypothetical protein